MVPEPLADVVWRPDGVARAFRRDIARRFRRPFFILGLWGICIYTNGAIKNAWVCLWTVTWKKGKETQLSIWWQCIWCRQRRNEGRMFGSLGCLNWDQIYYSRFRVWTIWNWGLQIVYENGIEFCINNFIFRRATPYFRLHIMIREIFHTFLMILFGEHIRGLKQKAPPSKMWDL